MSCIQVLNTVKTLFPYEVQPGNWISPNRSATCCMRLPDPFATLMTRELGSGSKEKSFGSGLSSSLSVMLSMMHMKRLMRIWLSFSLPCRHVDHEATVLIVDLQRAINVTSHIRQTKFLYPVRRQPPWVWAGAPRQQSIMIAHFAPCRLYLCVPHERVYLF